MSWAGRLLRFPIKLAGAVRRNGVRNVLTFAVAMARRQGLAGTVSYGLLTARERKKRRAADERAQAAPRYLDVHEERANDDRDLDSTFSLLAEDWAERMAAKAGERRRLALAVDKGAEHDLSIVLLVAGADHPPLTGAHLRERVGDDGWAVFLKAGDAPVPDMRQRLAEAAGDGSPDVITFDMISDRDGRIAPIYLPGANPWLARHADYTFSRMAMRVGAIDPQAKAGEPYRLLQGWLADRPLHNASDRWRHIAEPLMHIRLDPCELATERVRAMRVTPAVSRRESERVSIVVCTKDKGHLTRQLVRALNLDDPRIADLIIVANNTTNPFALETLDAVVRQAKVQVLVRNEPFNFSRLSNAGAKLTRGERLLFLNDDITPVSDDWLEPLLAPLRDPDVGISGPLLLYPNERVQHAGMYLGYKGLAGHTLRFAHLPEDDYLFYASAPREVSAVTGATMMVARACFEALNGFDEMLATFLQDVDFCLRAGRCGYASVFTPHAILIHMESASMLAAGVGSKRLSEQRERERAHFERRWPKGLKDPFHNPNFAVEDETLHTLSPP